MNILQILPRVPPSVCGVGDHALNIARALRDQHSIHTSFLVIDPKCEHGGAVEGFPARTLSCMDAATLSSVLMADEAGAFVLHYSGYSYHAKGAPAWLVRGLQDGLLSGKRLITMFHEVYASGPVTSPTYWYGLAQKSVAKKLARISGGVITNRRLSANWLESHAPVHRGRVACYPVISNFGESTAPVPPSRREPVIVLFQPPEAGTPFWDGLRKVIAAVQPSSIRIAGRIKSTPEDIPMEKLGLVSQEQGVQLISSARWIYFDYFDGYLGKSSLFSSFAGHGCACILASRNRSDAEGLHEGEHYLNVTRLEEMRNGAKLDACASALWTWYQSHSISATADAYASMIRQPRP